MFIEALRVYKAKRQSDGRARHRVLATFLVMSAAGVARAEGASATAPMAASSSGGNPSTAPAAGEPAGAPKGDGTRPAKKPDFSNMSIEELMNIQVTSVSGQEQRISGVAAAVYIIKQDDIQQTHYQRIPELQRLAPGVNEQVMPAGSHAFVSQLQYGMPAGRPSAPHTEPADPLKVQAPCVTLSRAAVDSPLDGVERQASIHIPAYFRWDASTPWNMSESVSFSGGMRNMRDEHPPEVLDGFTSPHTSEVPRAYFVERKARF